ncbi:MAG: DUF1592 domain-containing protein [Rhodospirillaceae bacterium]
MFLRPTASFLSAILAFGLLSSSALTTGSAGAWAAETGVAAKSGDGAFRRLTEDQYRQAISDLFGPDIVIEGRFEPITRQDGLLAVGTGKVGFTSSGFEQYYSMAHSIAAQVVDQKHRGIFIKCKPASATGPDEACARQFISEAGKMLYRRPLTEGELALHLTAANDGAKALKSFYSGIELSLVSMLTSSQFLFRTEVAEPNPEHKGEYRLDPYSQASKLSFFLWNSPPDRQLLAAADSGALASAKGRAKEIDRMMASPRLEDGVRAFFDDMFGFDEFSILAKDGTLYPKYTNDVNAEAREQTLRTITDLLINNHGDYRDIFTTRKTFLTPLLGSVYGVPVVQDRPNGYPNTWIPHEYPEGDPRTGVLTQVSFVALHSHPGRTSPTIRGKAIREMVLCQKVPDPPGNVSFKVLQDTSNPLYKTARERLKAHATEAMCTGCHKITDPIGLALENFDTAGSFRTTENGVALDTSGEISGVSYKDAPGLGKAIHDSAAATSCLVKRLTAYAVGRTPAAGDADWVASLDKKFAADNYRFTDLLRQIASSPDFYRASAPDAGL